MCGIWAVFGLHSNLYKHCGTTFTNITHRGPDAWRVEYDARIKNCCIGFHRLTIVDSTYGMQPMKLHKYPLSVLTCNGEIYNCKRIEKQFGFEYETGCDVECIFHLYQSKGIEECVKNLDGVFAFCIMDPTKKRVCIARDPYGVRPLFRLFGNSGVLAVSSEAKGIMGIAEELNGAGWKLEPFPPGTFEEYELLDDGSVKLLRQVKYHSPGDKPSFKTAVPYDKLSGSDILGNIKTLFTEACRKRLMADRRIGCLLSGGLDSSLVASLLVKLAKEENLPYKIQSFAIGMGDSPDLIAARKVAKHIGTDHHEIIFTEEDVANVLDDVIYALETADITTVRASIGMYLVAKYIKENTDTTVLFSGEGADELAQGYIYFRDAPSSSDAHNESLRLLSDIYLYDGLRADRTTAGHSLELRVPFLDLQFTNYFLSLDPKTRQPQNGVEKHLLRSAFDGTDLLPHEILWRHKEAFSDGVAGVKKSLFTIIQEIVDKRLPNEALSTAAQKYKHCTPKTKESLYYREIFEKSFPNQASEFLPYFWMPKWINVSDPSARFISHYAADKETK